MTKQNYVQQVANIPLVKNWDDELSFTEKLSYKLGRIETRKQAEKIAKEADEEIQKLKELLYISYRHNKETSAKMNPFIVQQIEEAINDA